MMMKDFKTLTCIMILAMLVSCSQENAELRLAPGLEGTWKIKMIFANDHWGAPLYWRDVQSNKQVRFTTDGKYYEKQDKESNFILTGNYEVTAEGKLTITWVKPVFPEYPDYTFTYYFEPGNYLVLGKGQFEGVVGEKYLLKE